MGIHLHLRCVIKRVATQVIDYGSLGPVTVTYSYNDTNNNINSMTVINPGPGTFFIALMAADGTVKASQTFLPGTNTTQSLVGAGFKFGQEVRGRIAPIVVMTYG